MRKTVLTSSFMALMLGFSAVTPVGAQSDHGILDSGMASYYGKELAGNRTANGETFNPSAMTAAHRSIPFGSKVRVTNLANGQNVVVRVNDRGPFKKSRIIDISHAAAQEIGMVRTGTARVSLQIVK